ncbi:MAG: hypothetical protein DRN15_05885 [Thermoprotei archaeon]|nr:MAG: hypothetical protein DRN15_05885 [Thermoprotei archaeon]RLF23693.1 MAG: hypothetical protein DRM97_04410 [Thermoprotei archaeon]
MRRFISILSSGFKEANPAYKSLCREKYYRTITCYNILRDRFMKTISTLSIGEILEHNSRAI